MLNRFDASPSIARCLMRPNSARAIGSHPHIVRTYFNDNTSDGSTETTIQLMANSNGDSERMIKSDGGWGDIGIRNSFGAINGFAYDQSWLERSAALELRFGFGVGRTSNVLR